MGYIDVGLDSARNSFWVNALKTGYSREYVRDALKGWKEMYLVRRTKEETLKHLLGTKTIKREMVEQHPEEIFLQECASFSAKNVPLSLSSLTFLFLGLYCRLREYHCEDS